MGYGSGDLADVLGFKACERGEHVWEAQGTGRRCTVCGEASLEAMPGHPDAVRFFNALFKDHTSPLFFDWRERPGGRPTAATNEAPPCNPYTFNSDGFRAICPHGQWRTLPQFSEKGVHIRECVKCGLKSYGTRHCDEHGHEWDRRQRCKRCGWWLGTDHGFRHTFRRGGVDTHAADAFEYVIPPGMRGTWPGQDATNFESDEAFKARKAANCGDDEWTRRRQDRCCHEFDELTKFCTLCGMALADFIRTDPYANGSRNLADDVAAWERENGIMPAPNCPTCSTKMAAKAVGPAHILRGTWECPKCWAEVVDTEATPVEPEPLKQLPAHGDGVH